MAMNKKEVAEMERLKAAAARSTALGWPQFPRPKSLRPSTGHGDVVVGWYQNSYSRRVEKVWQQGGVSYFNSKLENGSRSVPPVYATEEEAWQAMLHDLAEEYAKMMAEVRAKAFPDTE